MNFMVQGFDESMDHGLRAFSDVFSESEIFQKLSHLPFDFIGVCYPPRSVMWPSHDTGLPIALHRVSNAGALLGNDFPETCGCTLALVYPATHEPTHKAICELVETGIYGVGFDHYKLDSAGGPVKRLPSYEAFDNTFDVYCEQIAEIELKRAIEGRRNGTR